MQIFLSDGGKAFTSLLKIGNDDIASVLVNPSQRQEMHLEGNSPFVLLYGDLKTKGVKSALLLLARFAGDVATIGLALRVPIHLLEKPLAEHTPLGLLERFCNAICFEITLGSRTAKLIVCETIPMQPNQENDYFTIHAPYPGPVHPVFMIQNKKIGGQSYVQTDLCFVVPEKRYLLECGL